VRLNARDAAFPPNMAAGFDVIEIRRIWQFTETLKLSEELRGTHFLRWEINNESCVAARERAQFA